MPTKNDQPSKKRKPIVIDVDADPHNANWIRILEQQRLANQAPQAAVQQPPTPLTPAAPQPQPPQEETPLSDGLSTRPWEGDAADYKDAGAYADASLINRNTGPRSTWTKGKVALPIREPGGDYNRVALGAAASALLGGRSGGMQLTPAEKKLAARNLVSVFHRFKLAIPDSLQALVR